MEASIAVSAEATGNDSDLEQVLMNSNISALGSNGRVKGVFCSDVVFKLSTRVVTEVELNVLEKGLRFVPTPSTIKESELRED